MFKKTIFLLIFACSLGVQGEGRPPGDDQNSNWSIQYAFGKGNPKPSDKLSYTNSEFLFFGLQNNNPSLMVLGTQKITPSVEAYHTRFVAEYLPNIAGFQFGMNYSSFNLEYKDNISGIDTILLLQSLLGSHSNVSTTSSTSSSSRSDSILPILLLSSLNANKTESFSLHTATLDFASSIHFRPRKTFDPYLNVGIGLGSCEVGCTAGRVFARLGARLNLGGGFIYLEGEYNNTNLFFGGLLQSISFVASQALFGFGLYL